MMTLEQVQQALQDRRLRRVAEATGLAYNTVWRVASNRTAEVSYDVVKRLSDYLTNSEAVTNGQSL